MSDNLANDGLNLAAHRAPASVWGRRGWDGTPERLAAARILIGIGGAALAVQGVRQRSWSGRALAGLGGSLAWWALSGRDDLGPVRRWCAEALERAPWRPRDRRVLEASAESFPASDAPSWTPTVGTGLRNRTVAT